MSTGRMSLEVSLAAALLVGTLASISSAQIANPLLPAGQVLDALDEGLNQGFEETTAPYRSLDRIEGPWVDLLFPSVDPMVFAGNALYAVNTHGNTVVRFDDFGGQAARIYPMPWAPVSLAKWNQPQDGQLRLLVSCRGSNALIVLDPQTGSTEHLIGLPSEPADVLVLPARNEAFVACAGVDSVLQIDLVGARVLRTLRLPSKQPVFLSQATDGGVLVAPMTSGNNSISQRFGPGTVVAGPKGILDLEDPSIGLVPLPDYDLFHIDPQSGSVAEVSKDAGTLLFGHGINPATGEFWQLNIESLNKNPDLQSEPAVKGRFVRNRISISSLPQPGSGAVKPTKFINLDEHGLGNPIGQPYCVEFSKLGFAAVAGTLTDNVLILNASGVPAIYLDASNGIPVGAIPRGLELAFEQILYVYCWGTNTVEVFNLTQFPIAKFASLDLGHDPSPYKAGREIFFDGHNSEKGNASCASCHIEGRTDLMVWNLSDDLLDDKGPMTTQILTGIAKSAPYHWRGERPELVDFNGAFEGLLGGEQLDTSPGAEFDQFRAYLDSLHSPANPLQDERRLLNASFGDVQANGRKGDAVRGQDLFFEFSNPGQPTCVACHQLPVGSSGDTVPGSLSDKFPKRVNSNPPHFQELWRKEQPLTTITVAPSTTYDVATLGSGYARAGIVADLFTFVDQTFLFNEQVKSDLVEFVHQADQGLAPAVHRAVLLSAENFKFAADEVKNYLIPQAEAGNCGIAVFDAGGDDRRWAFDLRQKLFLSQDPSEAGLTLSELLSTASSNSARYIVLGLPVGMERRFALDFDDDGLVNGAELIAGTDPLRRDSDNDGHYDGPELNAGSDPLNEASLPSDAEAPVVRKLRLDWTTSRVARFSFETDEPATWSIALEGNSVIDGVPTPLPNQPAPFEPLPRGDAVLQRLHSALVTGLLPSTEGEVEIVYEGKLMVSDRSGNTRLVDLPEIVTPPFTNRVEHQLTVVDLELENISKTPNSMRGDLVARIQSKVAGPPFPPAGGIALVTRVLVNGVPSTQLTAATPNSFTIASEEPVVPGPFLIGISNVDGEVRVPFQLKGLQFGADITVNVEYVMPAPQNFPFDTNFTQTPLLGFWDFSATPQSGRSFNLIFN